MAARSKKKWSQHVTETSDAMDVAKGTFASKDPEKIARDVERDAERSTRRKAPAYRSAMSMLTFYINRAGKTLSPEHRDVLERAKDVLRERFGPDATAKPSKRTPTAKKSGAKKSSAKKASTRKKPSSRKKHAANAR
jgi:uncharacterized membrane protein